LDRWYKYVKDDEGDKKYTINFLGIGKNLLIFVCASKGESIETIGQG
jgi:hypothetical protein